MVRLSVCPLEYWEVDLRNFLYWTNAKTEKEITKKSYKRSVFFSEVLKDLRVRDIVNGDQYR